MATQARCYSCCQSRWETQPKSDKVNLPAALFMTALRFLLIWCSLRLIVPRDHHSGALCAEWWAVACLPFNATVYYLNRKQNRACAGQSSLTRHRRLRPFAQHTAPVQLFWQSLTTYIHCFLNIYANISCYLASFQNSQWDFISTEGFCRKQLFCCTWYLQGWICVSFISFQHVIIFVL